uniref:Uncharacterized protein n=1 Tax=viral metagenome TaxID=1070528 RepID=A0A6C0D4R3_9ZZZZ
MAALAIPIIVVGSLFILSEQEKKSGVKNSAQQQIEYSRDLFLNNNTNSVKAEGFSNTNTNLQNRESSNNNSNSAYNNSAYNNNAYNNVNLLSGQQTTAQQFKHNNMQPYFGAKIRGPSVDINNTESIMDIKQGAGSQNFSKAEIAPLFRPDENSHHPNGTPNNSDFFQSRMNESMKMSNVTLWEPQRVGPGLNLGYGSQNSDGLNIGGIEGGGGFNSGMMARESWMPKSVDDLRAENKPRTTFDLNGHQGPAIYPIKMQGPNNKIGVVEKHLPEKSFESGPNRWFTTTGVEQAPPIRSTQVIPMENRIDTTREYYGSGSNTQNGQATYTNPDYEESKRQNLSALPLTNASATGTNYASPSDYGSQSYNILHNNRTTQPQTQEFGGVYGMAKAAITPILDIFRPTRKENVIGNLRETGNVNGLTPQGHIYNSNDKTKITNREMTTEKIDMNYVNVQGQNYRGDGYKVSGQQNYDNQRTTTNKEYIGTGGNNNQGQRLYNNAYAQQNNVNKTYESRTNQGNMSLFNNYNNSTTARNDNIFQQNRPLVTNNGLSIIPSAEFIGELNGKQGYDLNYNNARLDESLLSAFKNNPYTQSLTSVA